MKEFYRSLITYNGDSVIDEDELGVLRTELDALTSGVRIYRFVKVADASGDVANGSVLTFTDAHCREVTTDISESNRNHVAGVGIGAITAGNKGWIQVYGSHSAVTTNGDDDITVGMELIVDGAVDGSVDSMAVGTAATHKTVGVATADDVDAANTVAAFLNCL